MSAVDTVLGDLIRPAFVTFGVLAWEFDDPHPDCPTTYVVYVHSSMDEPRVRATFWDGEVMDLPATDASAYGWWDTPREFASWARRYATDTPLTEETS